MAITYIDRDPEEMIRYGKAACEIVDQMTVGVRMLEGTLDFYKKDLDNNSQKEIEELHNCCNNFIRDVSAYRKIAETIEQKGKNLLNARNRG